VVVEIKLGKHDHKHDDKTIQLSRVLDKTAVIPSVFDFDKGRAKFPLSAWGNTKYGDCVMATRTNQLLRLERVETRRTPPITEKEVVDKYFELTGGPDEGLNMLDTNRDWRSTGWDIPTHAGTRHYTIDAFGEINVKDQKMVRQSIYFLHGVQFGFAMPNSAQDQTSEGYWDVADGPDGEPGSWGGHAVYGFAYDYDNVYVYSWGKRIRVTNEFVNKYGDEAWAVVDSLDKWREVLDVDKLRQILKDIGASGIE
jgi:hypothetical protein